MWDPYGMNGLDFNRPSIAMERILTQVYQERKKDISYLTNLPGASEKLKIFNADLDKPDSFDDPIQDALEFFTSLPQLISRNKEPEETVTKRAINGTLGILKACLNSKTVKRVVYTSSASAVVFNDKGEDIMDESSWSDVDFIRAQNPYGASYMISKTSTERAGSQICRRKMDWIL
ncbi:hypothetical protein L1049_019144 [Liquidambar formosana]|uniref:3-beta hydroxysteroid dehydrogenase/isomerase domain-containing protein n=1 Tax=Liquidambar formosana TaxID=63359 RepID=A0AAP0WPP3_LIQFO